MDAAAAAERQFVDNLQHFTQSPAEQNLYNGLGNLAKELQEISSRLQRMEAQLHRIEQKP